MTIIINGSNTPTAGAVAVGDGTTLAFTAAGTAGQILQSNGAGVPTWGNPAAGGVTSVNVLGGTTGLTTSGGPITTSGSITLAGTLAIANGGTGQTTAAAAITALSGTQTSGNFLRSDGTNTLLAAIQAGDVPTLNQNTTGTSSNVTGTVAIVNGGTGTTTAQNAINSLAGAVTSGSYLRGNGTNVVMNTIQVADVPTLNQNTTGTAGNVTGTVATTNGGTGLTSFTSSGILFASSTSVLATNANFIFDSNGNLISGKSSSDGYRFGAYGTTQLTSGYQLTYGGVAAASVTISSGNALVFGLDGSTGGTERTRISSSGGYSVGTSADAGAGGIYATGNITAYYSDARLKTVSGKIENALDKVGKLSGVYYTNNDTAKSFGYDSDEIQVGVLAQDVESVMPEIVKAAPFDLDEHGNSKSGENYKTVQYEKLIPLLIEAINELRAEVKALKGEQ